MASITSALPDITLNPAICPGDQLDLEVGFRNTFNYLLDADETGRNVRDAGRDIIRRFLEDLKAKGAKPRQAILDFVARTQELFESATGRIVQVRAASAKCLLEMWAHRTGVLTPDFQGVFRALKALNRGFPRRTCLTMAVTAPCEVMSRYLPSSLRWLPPRSIYLRKNVAIFSYRHAGHETTVMIGGFFGLVLAPS